MKSCVVTANYACDPNKVWLYLTKPTLNGWRRDVSSYEESDDGLKAAEKNTDGSETQIVFTRKEKPRCLSCNFQKGKISMGATHENEMGFDLTVDQALLNQMETEALAAYGKGAVKFEKYYSGSKDRECG